MRGRPTHENYVLAAHIRGKVDPAAGRRDGEPGRRERQEGRAAEAQQSDINVVLVADADMLSQVFFRLREQAELPELGVHFNFDNVTFVLNALDSLAGDNRFIDVRKRRPKYRTLTRIEQWTAKDRKRGHRRQSTKFEKDVKAEEDKEKKAIEDKMAELKQRKGRRSATIGHRRGCHDGRTSNARRRSSSSNSAARRTRNASGSKRELKQQVDAAQSWAKWMAVLLPPILPLVIAIVVFLTRRAREREGVARSRLR